MAKKLTYEELEQRVKELEKESVERKRTEEALRKSKEFAENLIASMKDGFSVLDNQGVHVNVNPSLCQMTGFTQEELVGTGLPHLYWPEEEHENIEATFEKTLEGKFDDFELVLKRKNGERFPAIVSPSWMLDEKGNVISYFATIKDITELKHVEAALQQRTHDLGERVKELNCLYGISELVEKPDISLDDIFQETVDLVPGCWQYPEITCARIIFNDQEFKTKKFTETEWKLASNIIVHGETVGSTEVCYLEERPEIDEGPFLEEEKRLLHVVAERLGHIVERIRVEEELRKAHSELEAHSLHLEEVNIALKVLLKQREEDRKDLEEDILSNVKQLVMPHLERLKQSRLDTIQATHLSTLESNLNNIVSPFISRLSSRFVNLTPMEIRVADLIKEGKTNKEIGEMLYLSPNTIKFHRYNVRTKLGLKNKRINLRSYLLSLAK